MKFFVCILVALLAHNTLFGQVCQQVKIANTHQEKTILRDYIKDCKQKLFISENKGAVVLIDYQDVDGITRWQLSAIVDDGYSRLVPEKYARFDNTIILIYKGDKNGRPLPIPGDTTSRAACIRNILGSQIHKRPHEQRFIYVRKPNGEEKKVPVTTVVGGNPDNSLIIIFNKNGTLSKLLPV